MAINGDQVLKNIITNFYSGILNFSIQAEDLEKLTWEKQKKFLEATVLSQIFKKYPVSNEFCKLFFKKLISLLETTQEVHDEFYSCLCSIMNNKCKKDFSYRHYIIGNSFEDLITIKETNRIVVNGTTGMRTWEAALILSDWLLCNKNVISLKHVLELGSGVGFTGITLGKFTNIKSITMTDCHNDVLMALCENIDINFPNFCRTETSAAIEFADKLKTLKVAALDWNYFEETQENFIPDPDIILGSDIVYDPEIIKPLCNVLKLFLSRKKETHVYLASIIRNENTYKEFLEELDDLHLVWETVPQTKGVFINWDHDVNSSIIKIKK